VIGQCCNFHGINCGFNAVIFTVSIPRLKYHEIFFRILADYRLCHLVNNVAMHIYAHNCIRMEITVLYPYIEEEQTVQWPKEKVQKNKQRSTTHTHKTKDRVTRTRLKTGGELRCSERVSRSGSTSDTRRVNLVTNPVISHGFKPRSGQTKNYETGIFCFSFMHAHSF